MVRVLKFQHHATTLCFNTFIAPEKTGMQHTSHYRPESPPRRERLDHSLDSR